jgi:hypothetical protein
LTPLDHLEIEWRPRTRRYFYFATISTVAAYVKTIRKGLMRIQWVPSENAYYRMYQLRWCNKRLIDSRHALS